MKMLANSDILTLKIRISISILIELAFLDFTDDPAVNREVQLILFLNFLLMEIISLVVIITIIRLFLVRQIFGEVKVFYI